MGQNDGVVYGGVLMEGKGRGEKRRMKGREAEQS